MQMMALILLHFISVLNWADGDLSNEGELTNNICIARFGTGNERRDAVDRLSSFWSLKPAPIQGADVAGLEKKKIDPMDVEMIGGLLGDLVEDQDVELELLDAAMRCLLSAPMRVVSVDRAIKSALNSKRSPVFAKAAELRIDLLPIDFDGVSESIITNLFSDDFACREGAKSLVQKYGDRFLPFTLDVISRLKGVPDSKSCRVLHTLGRTGISEEAADSLIAEMNESSNEVVAAVFVALLPYPKKASSFLRLHYESSEEIKKLSNRWKKHLLNFNPSSMELRSALIELPGLGPLELGLIGDPGSLPAINKLIANADQYERKSLKACARACGGPVTEQISIFAGLKSGFRPRSAWPNSDIERQGQGGHADGQIDNLVTGDLILDNGVCPNEVVFRKFEKTSENRILQPVHARYDPHSGRFVMPLTLHASFGAKPGGFIDSPYQTGSVVISIEGPGFSSILVEFFDEMPHVQIFLDRE